MKSFLKDIRNNIQQSFSINNDIGILNGISGYILYNAYYENFIEQKDDNFAETLINICIDKINSGYKMPTFCDGIAGFAWTLSFLDNNKINDIQDDIYEPLDLMVIEFFNYAINNSYDFLHGASGCIYYFYHRNLKQDSLKINFNVFFEKYIHCMEQQYIKIKHLKKFDEPHNFNQKTYSGLAHGIASYISILGKLSTISKFHEKCSDLSKKFYLFLMEYRFESKNKISLFPTWISETTKVTKDDSILSWCTGDLGIGLSLLNTGILAKNDQMKNHGFEILNHSSKRFEQHQSRLNTPNLCHGYFGAYKIFSHIYALTQEKNFLFAKKHWLNIGLESVKKNLPKDLFLINGQAGIGLALIDEYTETDHNWGECLLIS